MVDSVGKFVDFCVGVLNQVSGRNVQAEGAAGETLQAGGTRLMQHFGFKSSPPAGTELALVSGNGETASVAESDGDGAPAVPSGGASLYDTSGNVVIVKTDDGILIKNLSGNIIIENGDGEIRLHEVGAVEAARKGDTVGATTSMGTWITTITAAVNALGAIPTVIAPGSFGTITSGSSEVKIG